MFDNLNTKATDLAKEIYINEGENGLGMSYNYIKKYLIEIRKVKLEDFYIYSFNNYDFNYNISLLASSISLFEYKEFEFWKSILDKHLIKHKYKFLEYDFFKKRDLFVGFIFLYKYLNINSLEILNNLLDDKKLLKIYIEFFEGNFSILHRDFEFYENFEDGFYESINKFNLLGDRLIENSITKLKSAILDESKYNLFIESIGNGTD